MWVYTWHEHEHESERSSSYPFVHFTYIHYIPVYSFNIIEFTSFFARSTKPSKQATNYFPCSICLKLTCLCSADFEARNRESKYDKDCDSLEDGGSRWEVHCQRNFQGDGKEGEVCQSACYFISSKQGKVRKGSDEVHLQLPGSDRWKLESLYTDLHVLVSDSGIGCG